jgi:hypothetical protein
MTSRKRAAVHVPGGKLIDLHTHLWAGREDDDARRMLEEADLLGAEYLAISHIAEPSRSPSPEQIRQGNNQVARWVKQARGRFRGMAMLNPTHGRGAVEELRRCHDKLGMRMVKLLVAVRCTDRRVFPIVELCIELKIPILQHAFNNAVGNGPNESRSEDVAALARRYPEARIVMAHIAGDYIRGVWTIRDIPNIWTDISGSYCEAGMVDTAVRELGAGRVVFGSDNGIAFNLGKIQDAHISDEEKACICYRNAKELLP